MPKMQIKDNNGTNQSEAATLAKYYRKTGEETVSEFMAGMKALTPEGKTELAQGAAKELGWQVVEA